MSLIYPRLAAPFALSRVATFLGAAFLASLPAQALTFVYSDFSNLTQIQRNGSTAAITHPFVTGDGSVLRLTNGLSQSGSAFRTSAISLLNNYSFSTYFSFRISNPIGIGDEDGVGADGLAFLVQTVSNNAGGSGGGIGYAGIANSLAVEFDTYNNGGWDDHNGNHVGINLGGNIDSVVQTPIATRMNNGARWYSWVDYNGSTNGLEVRLSQTALRPTAATLTHTVNLATVLGSSNAFVGFTSGTGGAGGNHDIIEWEFRDSFTPVGVPEGGSTFALLLAAIGGLGLAARRSASRR